MYPFEYANPTTVKDAVALLGASWSDANILAGGTDQMNLMKDDLHQPKMPLIVKNEPVLIEMKNSVSEFWIFRLVGQ